jgi:hypothetical protein
LSHPNGVTFRIFCHLLRCFMYFAPPLVPFIIYPRVGYCAFYLMSVISSAVIQILSFFKLFVELRFPCIRCRSVHICQKAQRHGNMTRIPSETSVTSDYILAHIYL